jgi:eukaryotic-like serine/threonine-protein kinase
MKILVLLAVLFAATNAYPQDTMFRGNAAHSGVYDGAGVPNLTGVKWQFHTRGPIVSSPVVAGDTLYIGSGDHVFYALDAATGAVKWKFKTDGRITSTAAVSGSFVYFGSHDGNFYAVDAATGQLKWKFKTEGERRFAAKHIHGAEPATETMPDPFDTFLSSPAVWNDSVYFGSGDTNVYALDAATGNLKWKFKTGDVVHASPAISGGALFIGSWDSYFYSLDAITGKENWRFKTGEDHQIYNQVGIQSSAAVADGIVYFGCRDSKFYAVDAATGKERWSYNNKGSWVISSPAVLDDKVYFATSDTGLLHAFGAKAGTLLFTVDFNHWVMFSSPAIAGQMLYIGSNRGRLNAVDLKTQKVAWYFETENSKKNGPTYTKPDGMPNYEAAYFDFFYDDMVSGLQKMMSVGSILSSPVVAGNSVFVGSYDGNVYALK